MIKVAQTIFGGPLENVLSGESNPEPGNCFAACLASILELPIEDVPNFVAFKSDWWWKLNRWLYEKFDSIFIQIPSAASYDADCLGYFISSGKGPRGLNHSVVCFGTDGMVWDPHPSGDGIVEEMYWGVIIPRNPAVLKKGTEKCLANQK
jgi:hypothetical protein